jgi:hypothetical protein
MPRTYGTIQCAIWDDEDFLALSAQAQGTYLMLTTQRDIEACGLLALTLRRWARMVAQGDPAQLVGWLNELSAARFIVIDKETEELLVRTFAKWDGGYRHAVRCKAVVAAAEAIRSPTLRAVMAAELDRLGVAHAIEVPVDTDPTDPPEPPDRHSDASSQLVECHSSATPVPVESLSSGTRVAVESQRSGLSNAVGTALRIPHSETGRESLSIATRLPDPTCSRHPQGTDAPCARCARARATFEEAKAAADRAKKADQVAARRAERERRAEAVARCQLCNDDGYRLTNQPDVTGGVCNHQPLNPGGRDRAFAHISGGNL